MTDPVVEALRHGFDVVGWKARAEAAEAEQLVLMAALVELVAVHDEAEAIDVAIARGTSHRQQREAHRRRQARAWEVARKVTGK